MTQSLERWRAISKALGSPIGFILAIVALGAAVWVVAANRSVLEGAWESVRDAHPGLIALVAVLPVANWIVISTSFWILTRPYGRIAPGEMGALIASAWLLNYLPMRAGMVGRIAYHKSVNGVRVIDSVRVLVWGLALSVAAIGLLFALAWLPQAQRVSPASIAIGAAPLALALAVAPFMGERGRYAVAFACRYADAVLWAARYWAVFEIVGAPVSGAQAAILAAVTQFVGMLPVAGNGLGIREWAVGITSGLWGTHTATGLAADLVSRAGELIVVVPLGLLATAWVARSLAAHRRAKRIRNADTSSDAVADSAITESAATEPGVDPDPLSPANPSPRG